MDTSQWPQIYEGTESTRATAENNNTHNKKPILVRPNKEQALNCPRCNSTNTKFCYYNNYSLSQPRYLCKTCKRYWTEGGNLRNVPVGGGSRKNKRPSSSSSNHPSSTSSKKAIIPNLSPPQNPRTHHDGETLNLDFNPAAASSICHGMSEFGVLPFGLNFKNLNPHENPNFCSSGVSNSIGFGTSNLISLPAPSNHNPNSVFSSSGFGGFKPSLSFSLDHHGYGNDHLLAGQENPIATSSRLPGLPFDQELIKHFSTTTDIVDHQFDHHHGKGQGGSNGYWHGNGMIDGGSW